MVIFRSIRTLTDQIPCKNRNFLTATASSILTPTPFATFHPLHFSPPSHFRHHLLSPLSRWIAPFRGQGPLFLISPPWKLLQSATPLYIRGNVVVLSKVEGLRLDLLRNRIRSGFPVLDKVQEIKEAAVAVDGDGVLKSFVNLPNLISIARLASGPLLGWMIVNEMYTSAFVGLAISGATDWLDGYVARKMKIDSVVGSYLDPLADKVLIGSVALAMVHMDLLHSGLVGMVVLRDVGLVSGALYHRANSLNWKWNSWYDFVNLDGTRPEKVEPLFISKVNTVFQLLLVAAALLQPEFGTVETQTYITYLSWLVAGTTVGSTAGYGVQYMKNRSALLARKS